MRKLALVFLLLAPLAWGAPAGSWWYAVTALVAGGGESAQSNSVSVSVP